MFGGRGDSLLGFINPEGELVIEAIYSKAPEFFRPNHRGFSLSRQPMKPQ